MCVYTYIYIYICNSRLQAAPSRYSLATSQVRVSVSVCMSVNTHHVGSGSLGQDVMIAIILGLIFLVANADAVFANFRFYKIYVALIKNNNHNDF